MRFSILLLASLLARTAADLDVGVPSGSPLDHVRRAVKTPAGGDDTPTRDVRGTGTVSEDRNGGFAPLDGPFSVDFGGHLRWSPSLPNGTPTPGGAALPPVSNDLYLYTSACFLMVLLHPSQVSERELVSFLIEIGEPALMAASAAKNESALQRMAREVTAAVAQVPLRSSAGSDEFERKVIRELTSSHPYEPGFAKDLLTLPDGVAVPVLLKLSGSGSPSFLQRNAVFALRAFDSPEILPRMRALLKSGDRVVRNRALAVLIRDRDREAVPELAKLLETEDLPFRSYVAHALGRIGDPAASVPLLRALRKSKGDPEFLWTALPALARLGVGGPAVEKDLHSFERGIAALGEAIPRVRPDRPDPPGLKRKILLERVAIARHVLSDGSVPLPSPVSAASCNRPLLAEVPEMLRVRESRRKASPLTDPVDEEPERPDPESGIAGSVYLEIQRTLNEYHGVKGIQLRGESVQIFTETEEDAADLRILLGKEIRGVRLEIQVDAK